MVEKSPPATWKVVQWTTGNVGRQAVRAVIAHPDLELVGVFARDPSKGGVDAADLCGLDRPTGVMATGNVEELLALRPDCVIYTPLHLDVDELSGILHAGVNVVTTSEFVTGTSIGADGTATLESAAQSGGVTLFGTGINPGFAQLFASVSAGISQDVRRIAVTESVDVAMFAARPRILRPWVGGNRGAPRGTGAAVEAATAVFADALDMLAGLVGLSLDERRCSIEFAHATEDLDVPGMLIPKDHVAGLDIRWDGLVGGVVRLSLQVRWVIGDRIEPPWTVELGYVVEVEGDPNIRIKLDLWPDGDLAGMGVDEFREVGMRITAVPAVKPSLRCAPLGQESGPMRIFPWSRRTCADRGARWTTLKRSSNSRPATSERWIPRIGRGCARCSPMMWSSTRPHRAVASSPVLMSSWPSWSQFLGRPSPFTTGTCPR